MERVKNNSTKYWSIWTYFKCKIYVVGKVTSTFQSIKDEEEKSERKFNEELMSNSRYSTDDEGNSTAETVEPNTSKSLLEMSDSDLESSIQSAENSINRTGII